MYERQVWKDSEKSVTTWLEKIVFVSKATTFLRKIKTFLNVRIFFVFVFYTRIHCDNVKKP